MCLLFVPSCTITAGAVRILVSIYALRGLFFSRALTSKGSVGVLLSAGCNIVKINYRKDQYYS